MKEWIVSSVWVSLLVLWMIVLSLATLILATAWWRQRQRKRAEGDESDWPSETLEEKQATFNRKWLPVAAKARQQAEDHGPDRNRGNTREDALIRKAQDQATLDKWVASGGSFTSMAPVWSTDQSPEPLSDHADAMKWAHGGGKPYGSSAEHAQPSLDHYMKLAAEDKLPNLWIGETGDNFKGPNGERTSRDEEKTAAYNAWAGELYEKVKAMDRPIAMNLFEDPEVVMARQGIIRMAVNAEVAPDHETPATHFNNPTINQCDCRQCRAARWGAPDGSIPKELETDAPHVEAATLRSVLGPADSWVRRRFMGGPATIAAPAESQPEKSETSDPEDGMFFDRLTKWGWQSTEGQRSGRDRRDHMHTYAEFLERHAAGLPTRREDNVDRRRAATIAAPVESQPEKSGTDLSKPVFWRVTHQPGTSVGVNNERAGERRVRETPDWGPIERRDRSSDQRAATIATPQVSQPENSETEQMFLRPETCCGHASDCAVHNAPALPVGPCDCGAAGSEWPAIERRNGNPLPEHMRGMNERRLSARENYGSIIRPRFMPL